MPRWLLNTSKKRDFTTSLGPSVPVFDRLLPIKKILWMYKQHFPYFSLCILPLILPKQSSILPPEVILSQGPCCAKGTCLSHCKGPYPRWQLSTSPRQPLLAASYHTLNFYLLLTRKKKANIELPSHIIFLSPVSFPVLLPGLFPLSASFFPYPPLAPLHSLFSFTSCTLASAPQSLAKCSRQPEVEVFMATSLPGNPGPHKPLGNSRGLYQAVQANPPLWYIYEIGSGKSHQYFYLSFLLPVYLLSYFYIPC